MDFISDPTAAPPGAKAFAVEQVLQDLLLVMEMEMGDAGRKRGHKIESFGRAMRKKIDRVAEERIAKLLEESRKRDREEEESLMVKFVVKYLNEWDWSDQLAVDARMYRDGWEYVWASSYSSLQDTSQ